MKKPWDKIDRSFMDAIERLIKKGIDRGVIRDGYNVVEFLKNHWFGDKREFGNFKDGSLIDHDRRILGKGQTEKDCFWRDPMIKIFNAHYKERRNVRRDIW